MTSIDRRYMKLPNTSLYALLTLLSLSFTAPLLAQTAERDTISREMILERDFVPAANQAKKAYFNPLAGTKTQTLKPLNFANNTYEVSMNVRPHLFNPIENSLAMEPLKNAWHLRLLGGYPTRYGANLGMIYKVNEYGSVELALDHLSQNIKVTERGSGYVPLNKTHDTSLGLKYNGKLADRVFAISADVFNHMHTMYGYGVSELGTNPKAPSSNPLYKMTGGALYIDLSPAPVALRSPWQYSLYGNIGYTRKQDVIETETGILPEDPRLGISGMDLKVGGNLAYGIMSYNINVGVDAVLAGNQLFGVTFPDGTPASQYMSIDPYLAYTLENFSLKAGARLQLLSFGHKRFLVTPKIQMRWDATDMFALIAEADGGATINSMRDLYRINRYAQGSSAYFANDIAQYTATLGVQLGNMNGFSAEVRGGYADYLNMYDWKTNLDHIAPNELNEATERLAYFSAQDKGRVKNFFVSAGARYISPIGLQASVGMKYNKYNREMTEGVSDTEETQNILSGRPTMEMAASLDYQISPSLTAHVNLSGLGGIKFIISGANGPYAVSMPFITELDARLSYKLHPNIGLSLMGLNLLNQKAQRWVFYERTGASVVGAVTFSF